MEWNLNSKLLLEGFCLELAKRRYKETAGKVTAQSYAWSIYCQTDVYYLHLVDKIVIFAYKGQEILRVPSSRITTHNSDIWLTEEEAEKSNAMIGLIDSFF